MRNDDNNQLQLVTDPLGKVTTYVRDQVNRLTQMTDANDNTTSYDYDFNGRLTTLTDGAGETTTYAYDGDGRMIAQTDPGEPHQFHLRRQRQPEDDRHADGLRHDQQLRQG